MNDEISDKALDQAAAECICRRARMAARKITRTYDEALSPTGLKITQFTLLVAIAKGAPDSVSLLAEALGMERTTLVRNLKLLEDQELVVTRTGQGGRAKAIRLTTKGRHQLAEAYPYWEKAQAMIRQQLGAQEWFSVLDMLNQLERIR